MVTAEVAEGGTVLARTRKGALALTGEEIPLSGGFRQLLRLIDGRRDFDEVRSGMAHLDDEDFGLWIGELMRQGMIVARNEAPVEDKAHPVSAELPADALCETSPETRAAIDDIMSDVSRNFGSPVDAQVQKRLATTGRMAAIETVRSHASVGRAGFFVYPDAADGLPESPRVCIAGHLPAQNKVLKLLFTRGGARVSTATSRDQMRAALALAEKPHILVVDAEMPMLDAFRTLDAIRIDAELTGVRMVIVSSRSERAALAQAMILGAAAYIVKPLRKDVLDVALPQILGRALPRS